MPVALLAKPAGSNVGEFEPLSIADLAAQAGRTGGPINGHAQLNVTGAGPGFGVRMTDLPMSPPRLSAALDAATPRRMAAE